MSSQANVAVASPGLEPTLLRRRDAARYCGLSASTWDRLSAAGKIPRPMRLGNSPVWSRAVLDQWVAAGLPEREVWERLTTN